MLPEVSVWGKAGLEGLAFEGERKAAFSERSTFISVLLSPMAVNFYSMKGVEEQALTWGVKGNFGLKYGKNVGKVSC